MSTCPNGHQSNTDDWCEVCGHRMTPPDTAAPSAPYAPPYQAQYEPHYESQYRPQHLSQYESPHAPDPGPTARPSAPTAEPCPICGTPREGLAQYCEECRYN